MRCMINIVYEEENSSELVHLWPLCVRINGLWELKRFSQNRARMRKQCAQCAYSESVSCPERIKVHSYMKLITLPRAMR